MLCKFWCCPRLIGHSACGYRSSDEKHSEQALFHLPLLRIPHLLGDLAAAAFGGAPAPGADWSLAQTKAGPSRTFRTSVHLMRN